MKPNHLLLTFLILTFAICNFIGFPAAYAYDPMCSFYEEHHGECCATCHDMVSCSTPNLYCVPTPISTPNSSERPVVYDSLNSQVVGAEPYNGICEVCHTQTKYHRNNVSGDHAHYSDKKCTSCHLHGPATMVSKGICYTCHGGQPGDVPDGNPPMFSSPIRGHAEAEGGGCDDCHGHDAGYGGAGGGSGTYSSHSTHTENDSDDLMGPNMTCADCHDTSSYPDFADSTATLAATTVCDNCHSAGGAFDGVAMAKANWENGIYEADGKALKSGKGQWCATCHDNAPAFSKRQLIDPVVVDNIDHGAGFDGSWGTSSYATGYYGTNYQHHAAGEGTDKFTWTPTITTGGRHQVFARWTTSGEEPDVSRANDATYTIYHDGGSTPVTKDQQYNGGEWVSLGVYSFDGTGVEKVELVQSASGIVIADAVKLVPPSATVDNPAGTPAGAWGTSSYAPGYYGANYHYHAAGGGTEKFIWTPTIITTAGTYKVWARWTTSGEEPDVSRANNATYTIYHDGGSTPVTKDQQYSGGQWVSLGAYSFDGAGDEKVELVQSASGIVIADAIMFAAPDYIPEVLVDNTDPGDAIPNGDWNTSSYAPGYWGSNIHYHAAGGGPDKFIWTPAIATAGTYKVWARWTTSGEEPDSSRANDATYTIYHDEGSTTVEKDQRYNGGEWVSLGAYSFDGAGVEKVELAQSANGLVVADAIVWCSPDESPPPKPGIYAPNVIGDNSTYGFYATGHGAHGLVECLSCHNARTKHIDHEHRTYASARNNYQAGYRLAKPMVVPRPHRGSPPNVYANLDDFALCIDCHNPYEVLGEDYYDESRTNFCEDAAPIRNGHNLHIKMTGGEGADTDWDGVLDSNSTCITCHNVHGPPNQAMVRHGELVSTYGTTDKVPGLNFSYLTSLSPKVSDTEADVKDSVGSQMLWVDSSFAQNGFCNGACHGTKTMARAPYLGPKILTNEAYPNNVPADGTTEVLITALVADHNDNVPSDGVTIDLSPIDGGVEIMYDDGINGGDLTADDNIFSYTITVPVTVASGYKNLQVTATDPDGEGECSIILHVQTPGEVVLDNPGAAYVGTWISYTHSDLYEGEGQYHEAGSGVNTATWTPNIPEAGYYNVYAWWHSNPTARASDAPFTINYDGGSETIDIDQSRYGGVWVLLGTYPFAAGTSGSVVLSDDADDYVIADAVKFEGADPDVVIRDDINAAYVGTWPPFTNSVLYGGEAQYHEAGSGANTATWTPLILETGDYKVYARWAANANRATDAPFTIYYDGGSETIDIDMSRDGGVWNLLGTYPFAAGTSGSVVLSDDANGYVNADAIKWELQP